MYSNRLQILIDDERLARLQREAARRRLSVAVIVRDAIDVALPAQAEARRAAGERILAAEQMPVPADVGELKRELAERYARYA